MMEHGKSTHGSFRPQAHWFTLCQKGSALGKEIPRRKRRSPQLREPGRGTGNSLSLTTRAADWILTLSANQLAETGFRSRPRLVPGIPGPSALTTTATPAHKSETRRCRATGQLAPANPAAQQDDRSPRRLGRRPLRPLIPPSCARYLLHSSQRRPLRGAAVPRRRLEQDATNRGS